jgi:acyl-CoA thioesterase
MMKAQERAEKCARIMLKSDSATKHVGVKLEKIRPGYAEMSMKVEAYHLNGHAICHGGFILTLADSTFAFACNSYNELTVAQFNTINFLETVGVGEVLIATAEETNKRRRTGIYDVRVVGFENRVIAEMRGCSRTLNGKHFEEEE